MVKVNVVELQLMNEVQNIDMFCRAACESCKSEWYCPNYCEWLEKARKMPFEKIQKAYVRNQGDMRDVYRYVKNYKM